MTRDGYAYITSSQMASITYVSAAGFDNAVAKVAGVDGAAVNTFPPNSAGLVIDDANIVESLPERYPESGFIVHAVAFTQMLSGDWAV